MHDEFARPPFVALRTKKADTDSTGGQAKIGHDVRQDRRIYLSGRSTQLLLAAIDPVAVAMHSDEM
jgi:hypothetical protein